MFRRILLATLLICSVCALDLELHRGDFPGDELERLGKLAQSEQLPGLCWACKWAMGKLKRLVSTKSTQGEIRTMLSHVCDEIGFLKYLCRTFVARYINTLVEELSTTDNARTICVNIGVC
ncbi:antimicrobial peptide NK-lysin-like [Pimephales promelas]|uniref:antimicrobial peptide NK-lysin-like n=1 Tax=Pimephales promelas TaxID=90988 RepID=UPI001955A531|nr:antimicrobial peptide NK-lysin-like [Pimephales promelas]